jgi:hypothetical protein
MDALAFISRPGETPFAGGAQRVDLVLTGSASSRSITCHLGHADLLRQGIDGAVGQ